MLGLDPVFDICKVLLRGIRGYKGINGVKVLVVSESGESRDRREEVKSCRCYERERDKV